MSSLGFRWWRPEPVISEPRGWSRWISGHDIPAGYLRLPARIVPDIVSEVDPEARGPIVATETRTGSARAILDRAAADLAAIGVECRVSEHRESAVAAMGGPVVVHLGLAAAVRDPDEVVP